MPTYSKEYCGGITAGSRRSAREIIPIILELIRPQSVIDVGCGNGGWLAEFLNFGVKDILGVDGDYIAADDLQIAREKFLARNLEQPPKIKRQFDLALSLEVAEHLAPEWAETFIDSLVRLAPVVVFSAAIPCQGGIHHINEQWPEYWIKLFADRQYQVIDCLRKKIWSNDKIEWWYIQNIFIFIRQDKLDNYPKLKQELAASHDQPSDIVHPRNYIRFRDVCLTK
jgi:SAM-dependent methyltransferase